MSFDLIPRTFLNSSSRLPSIFDDFLQDDWTATLPSSGLTVSEDENTVKVEAAMPGLESSNIEVTMDKGVLWVRGSRQESEEDKKKKFYRKASSSFSYRIVVPGNIDENRDPEAVYKNGIMHVTFHKIAEVQPKKIEVKSE